jgi:hypothetical protein
MRKKQIGLFVQSVLPDTDAAGAGSTLQAARVLYARPQVQTAVQPVAQSSAVTQPAATMQATAVAIPQNLSTPTTANNFDSKYLLYGALGLGAVIITASAMRKKKKKVNGVPIVPLVVVGGLGLATYLLLKKFGIVSGIGEAADTYSVNQIIGKTLITKKRIGYYRNPGDHQTPVGYIDTGQPVGVVVSWLDANPTQDRQGLWWMFYDTWGNPYYTPHQVGLYDISSLQQQGVLTDEQLAEQDQSALQQNIDKYLPWVLGGAVVVVLGGAAIKKLL